MNYVAIFEKGEDGTWGGYVPDLPGCTTLGSTLEEVRANMVEAVTGHVEVLRELGHPVPEPTTFAETVQVA